VEAALVIQAFHLVVMEVVAASSYG